MANVWLYYLLKTLHVLLAAFWVGATGWGLLGVQPLLAQATPPARRELQGRLAPLVLKFHNAVGGFVFLSGVLVVLASPHPHTGGDLTGTTWGKTILFAIVATLLLLYLVNTSLRSTFKALGKVSAQLEADQAPPANLRFLQGRLLMTGWIIFGVQVLIVAMMVYANVGPGT